MYVHNPNNCFRDLPFGQGHRKLLFEVLHENPSGYLLEVILCLEVAILFLTSVKLSSFHIILADKQRECAACSSKMLPHALNAEMRRITKINVC